MRYALPFLLLFVGAGCADKALVDDPLDSVPPRVEIDAPVTALMPGAMTQLSAVYFDGTGQAIPQTAFTWTTSDPAIATIASNAIVTGVTPGQAMIQASANGVASEALVFTVVADVSQVAHVTVSPTSVELRPGETRMLTVMVTNVDGTPLPDAPVTWATDLPAVATVNQEGLVSAQAPGTASITATADGVTSAPTMVDVPSDSRSGVFNPTSGHDSGGEATLVRQADGTLLLSFGSDFRVTDGPSLFVYLSNFRGVDSASLQVAPLTSIAGAQSYLIEGVTIDQYDFAVVYCVPFRATFAWALFN